MNEIHSKIQNKIVREVFESYRLLVRKKLLFLRELIYAVAAQNSEIGELEECLKWAEPSYLAKGGSTVRINWKSSSPEHYAIYFNCKTILIETFKELYGDIFCYEGNRAIVFNVNDEIPVIALKHCIELSLNYHRIKHLPLLGA